ncbi:MAG: methyl-accepting chemotaxis protein [Scytonema sp. PMC 1069.18]|nr:methyl-accepting chemotaxis protein [Scytonema sp. PMC 1069.18]MEC4885219.1 methyl-accepting chemotaxis protein [Scytonema sp. PMC 1070.18]
MTQNLFGSFIQDSQKKNTSINSSKTPQSSLQWGRASWWKAMSLSIVDSMLSLPKSLPRKVAILAIVSSVIPVATVGGIAYTLASRSITAQIFAEQESRILGLRSGLKATINRFVEDAEAIAKSPLLIDSPQLNTTISKSSFSEDPKDRKITPVAQEVGLLDSFVQASNGKYDAIAVFNPMGKLLFQSHSSQLFSPKEDYFHQEHFQRAIATQAPVLSNPTASVSMGKSHLQVAVPIKRSGTGEILGIVLIQMSSEHLGAMLKDIQALAWEYQMIDPHGQIFAATDSKSLGRFATVDYDSFSKSWAKIVERASKGSVTHQVVVDKNDREEVLASFTTMSGLKGVPEPGWTLGISLSTAQAYAPLQKLGQILLLGIGVAVLLVGIGATVLAQRATRPLLDATSAMKKMSQGKLNTRLDVRGEDELAVLCSTINNMAEQIQKFVQEKEVLQERVFELLLEVDPVSRGDLTVHANVTDDEVGTVASSYNYVIESLRRIVIQVQTTTNQVEANANNSEGLVQALYEGASHQLEKIMAAIQQIQAMNCSIQVIARNAKAAQTTVQEATEIVEIENELMNLTVEGIVAIRETVAETAKKVKHLGESSQKIFTVVNLIKNFAEQTNVLALNASIEAARAGEEGRGFAIVAEEIRELAQQSAKATDDIEKLISNIQRATGEVVAAMEVGTEQVVSGSKLVDETLLGLNQIVTANHQIKQVVETIARATVVQAENSESFTQTMKEVAIISKNTTTSATNVLTSFKELFEVAKLLQKSVSQFKVQ